MMTTTDELTILYGSHGTLQLHTVYQYGNHKNDSVHTNGWQTYESEQ